MTVTNEYNCCGQNGNAGLLTIYISNDSKQSSMSFSVLPVFLAFILNRCSVRFISTCRCILGFTPYSASLLYGLSLVAILVKHPELYPCWLRRVNVKIMFLYELIVSLIFIELGFCLWNSLETFIFFQLPSFLEEVFLYCEELYQHPLRFWIFFIRKILWVHVNWTVLGFQMQQYVHCTTIGEYYIHVVESPVGVSLISNFLATVLLLFILHITKVCNFGLLLKTNGIHKFFADAGLTSKICRHHKEMRDSRIDLDNCIADPICSPTIAGRPMPSPFSRNSVTQCYSPKMLRSGKKIY